MSQADLSALSRSSGATVARITPPRRRWATRVFVPAIVVLAAGGLLAYAARESLRPTIPVTVAPVVLKVGATSQQGSTPGKPAAPTRPGEVVQAAGWIEADPYAVGVPALAEGVMREILVLEGQRVEAGQVVARLVDDDAKLSLKRAKADVSRMTSSIEEARQAVIVEQARVAEAQDAADRVAPLVGRGVMSEGEIASRRLFLAEKKAAVEAAQSAVRRAETELEAARVMVDEAELRLSRMEVRSPIAGVVLARLIEPGQRLMPDANNPFAGVVVRIYDPQKLQVRIDIPLADAAKVRVGDSVEVTTEALPDRIFHAKVTRFVHEANLQKNTVQVKAAISDPLPELKPEMLTKSRISTGPAASDENAPALPTSGGVAGILLAPRAAMVDLNDKQASAWVVDQTSSTAQKRRVALGHVSASTVEVLDGLRPGDRVIVSPQDSAGLREGTKVKPTESPAQGEGN